MRSAALRQKAAELTRTIVATPTQPHSVDLNNPERVIMVQVIKSVAALAVLPEYYALCKYNLRCGRWTCHSLACRLLSTPRPMRAGR